MTSWRRWAIPVAAGAMMLWLLASPASRVEPVSDLIGVVALSPHDVELGDRLVISGEGFPAGKPARVTFRGDLRRAPSATLGGAEVVLPGTVTAPDRVEVEMTDAALGLFCGTGDAATHATFSGDVEVAFVPASPGAAPVVGILHDATVDVRPGPSRAEESASERASLATTFLGLRLVELANGQGALVDQVAPGSRAESAGLLPGDVVTTCEGLHVETLADLSPAPGERTVQWVVRRGSQELLRSVSFAGFQRAPGAEGLASLVPLLFASLAVVLYAIPLPMGAGAWLHRILLRVRRPPGFSSAVAPRRSSGVPLPTAGMVVETVVQAIVWAAIVTMPLSQLGVVRRMDVGVLFIGATCSSVLVALAAERTGVRGLMASVHVVWQHLPAGLAIVMTIGVTGCIKVGEMAEAQGSSPLRWSLFQTPGAPLCLALLMSCAWTDLRPRRQIGLTALADVTPLWSRRERAVGWSEATMGLHGTIVAFLAVVLFLGGWSLPGLRPRDDRVWVAFVQGLWLLGKTLALAALTRSAKRWLPVFGNADRSRLTALALLPLAGVAAGADLLWARMGAPLDVDRAAIVPFMLATVLGLACIGAHWLRHAFMSPAAANSGRVSPFV